MVYIYRTLLLFIGVLLALIAISMASCGGAAPSGPTAAEACDDISMSLCARWEGCGFGPAADCRASFRPRCCSGAQCNNEVDGTKLQACLVSVAAVSCDFIGSGGNPCP